MHVKVEIMRATVFDIYKRENKSAGLKGWDDLEMSVVNPRNSMALHRSVLTRREHEFLSIPAPKSTPPTRIPTGDAHSDGFEEI